MFKNTEKAHIDSAVAITLVASVITFCGFAKFNVAEYIYLLIGFTIVAFILTTFAIVAYSAIDVEEVKKALQRLEESERRITKKVKR